MGTCPNTSSQEWSNLVNQVGEVEAFRDFYESGTIRPASQVINKINERTTEETNTIGAVSYLQQQVINYNNITGDSIASNLLSRLNSNLGVDYNIITQEVAEDLLKDTEDRYSGQAGFYFNNKVYLVKGKFNAGTVFHEFAHPLVDAIAIDNPTLFEKLYNDALSIPGLKELVDENYGHHDAITKKKEVVVRALTESATLNENPSFLKRVLYAIRQLLRKIFSKGVKVSSLNANTSLEELAELMQSEEFNYEFVDMSATGIVQSLKNEQDWRDATAQADANEIAVKIGELKNIASIASRYLEANPELTKAITNEGKNPNPIQQLLSDLGKVQKVTPDIKAQDTIETLFKINLEVLYQGVKDSQRLVQSLEDLSLTLKGDVTQEDLGRVMAISKIAGNTAIWAQHMVEFAGQRNVGSNNSFVQELNEVINKAVQVENNIYESLLELATEFTFENLSDNLIESGKTKWEEQMAKVKKTGSKKKLEKLEKRKSEYFITKEDIKARLQGYIKDAPLVSMVEAFIRSSDPIVSTFAKWYMIQQSKVEVKAQKYMNDMFNELFEEASKVGYKPGQEQEFWSQLTFLSKSFRPKEVNPNSTSVKDRMSVEEHEVYSFLTPYKDHKWFFKQLTEEIGIAAQDNNKEEYSRLQAKKRLYSRFMYSEKAPEFFEAQEIFEKGEYGPKAYAAKEQALANIKYIDVKISALDVGVEEADLFAEKEQALKEYQRLFRVTNLDGTRKSKEDVEIAKILKEYRNSIQGLYKYEEQPGVFEMEYERFIDSLYESGLNPQEDTFINERDAWILDNTEIALKDSFKDQESKIYDELKEISKQLTSRDSIKIDKLYEELQDLTSGFKDNNLQVEANDLDPAVQKRIKEIEEEIDQVRNNMTTSNGLTRSQNEFLSEIFDKIKDGTATDEEKAELTRLYKERNFTENQAELVSRRNVLLAELRSFKSKIYSVYYYEVMQEHLDRIKEEGSSNPAFSVYSSSLLAEKSSYQALNSSEIQEILNDPILIETLLQDSEFKKWFNSNHRLKSRKVKDPVTLQYVKTEGYEPTGIWFVKKPQDKYLKSIELSGEKYFRSPKSVKYKSRVPAVTTEKVPGLTVNPVNSKEWLPNVTVKEVITKDGEVIRNPFINDQYFELKRANPALFKYMEKVKEFHLRNQKNVSEAGRLGYEIPRFERQAYDKISNLAKEGIITSIKEQAKDIRQSVLGGQRQKFEQGLNYEAKLLINEGLVGDELNQIPISGVSKMDNELVNLNIFRSMALYGTSALTHEMLIETSPVAQMLLKVLEDPRASLKDSNKIKKNIALQFNQQVAATTGSKSKGSNSVRESLVRSLYERDWLGQRYVEGLFDRSAPKSMETAKKVGSAMSKVAANSYFAFNISSALKNRFTAIIQNTIEAAAGEYVNFRSLKRGKVLSAKATADLSSKIFYRGTKSKNIQIVQIFNIDGQLNKTSDPMYRTLGRDTASGSWALSARKLMELNASLELLFGMMDFQKVSLKDGSKISLYDAMVIKDGQISIREDVVDEWSLESNNFNEFKIKFQGVFDRLQGNYKDINQPMADRYFLFKQAAFMRKFFVSMFMRRFARERAQSDIGQFEEGYYITSFEYLRDNLQYFLNKDKGVGASAVLKPNVKEQAALKRLGMDVGIQFIMAQLAKYMLVFLFDYDEDDPTKKSTSKLRRATGALPFPGVVDDRDFNLLSFVEIHAINQLMQVSLESASFNPHSFSKYGNLYLTGSEFVTTPFSSFSASVGGVYRASVLMSDYFMGNSTGYYTRKVGPMWYQQKYSPKYLNETFKLLGAGGTKDLDAAERLISTKTIPVMRRTGR